MFTFLFYVSLRIHVYTVQRDADVGLTSWGRESSTAQGLGRKGLGLGV